VSVVLSPSTKVEVGAGVRVGDDCQGELAGVREGAHAECHVLDERHQWEQVQQRRPGDVQLFGGAWHVGQVDVRPSLVGHHLQERPL
jgi:hypothetical protein